MLATSLPFLADIDPMTVILVMAGCFAAAALSGLSGFGAGMIIAVFITPIIGAAAVIPVLSVVMILTNLSRVWFFFGNLNIPLMMRILPTALPASMLGSVVYVNLDADLLQMLLGFVLLLSVPLRRLLARRRMTLGTASLVASGGVFGFLSSIMVGAGMLLIPLLLGAGLAGPALLATDAAIAVAVNITKIVMFGTLEALDIPLFLLALAMGLCTIPGTWVASWIMKRTDLRIHTFLVEALVVVCSIAMILQSFR